MKFKGIFFLVLATGLFSKLAWSDIHTIDILAVYPPSMANSDPVARIVNMEHYANKALENSNANIRFRVVHIEELDLPNAKTDSITLANLRTNSEAQSLRSLYGADLVTMIAPTGPYCGVGYLMRGYNGTIYSYYKSYGFSVVGHSCTSSFAHELGHNLTLGHSYKQGSSGGLYSWGRGHGVVDTFVTTMAYTSAYQAPRIQMFSTPELDICKDLACGSSDSLFNGADAVKALSIAGPQVAAWNESKVPVDNSNSEPTANDDMDTTEQGKAITIDVLANDSDPDQDLLSISNIGIPNHGTITIVNNSVLYTPDTDFIGQDDIEYTISDGHDHTATATVSINVGIGVKYQYFEGSWTQLPDFSIIAPKSEGVVHNFSISKREREIDYAIRFSGQIEIPATGLYHFYLKSDDGSQLVIDDQTIVSNDSSSGIVETSGSVTLTAGLHAIEVLYFQQQGEQSLAIDWQGPTQARQMLTRNFLRSSDPILNAYPVASSDTAATQSDTPVNIEVLANDYDPDGDTIIIDSVGDAENGTVLVNGSLITYTPDAGFSGKETFSYSVSDNKGGFDTAIVTVNVGSGLAYEYFEGSWDKLPDFDSLTPVKTGIATDFSLKERNQNDNFAMRYRAELVIPNSGVFYFYLLSDEGSRLWIDDKIIVNNDGLHSLRIKSGGINLTAGNHKIEIEYFEKLGEERFLILWRGNGVGYQTLKKSHLVLPAE